VPGPRCCGCRGDHRDRGWSPWLACRLRQALPSADVHSLLTVLSCGRDEVAPSAAAVAAVIEAGRRAGDFATLPLYRLLKRERLQRVLLALELHARSNKTESIRTNQKLSVEHLLPQNWDEHWPLSRDIEEADRERTTRLELLHTVGNLTLVTGSLNSALSNSSWVLKRRHLLEHSALTLNRRLPESWSTSAIRVRASELADLAVDLWKRPAPLGALPLYASPLDRDLRPDRDRSDTAVESPSTAGRSVTGRRDIGKHVEYVYADLPARQFLTVSEIARRPSPEYSGKPPSAGAISARLFPSTGRTTLQGVVPDVQGGIRGARKI